MTEMNVYVRLRHELRGGHRHVRVFIGKDWDHLQKSGDLVFADDERVDEWSAFLAALTRGSEARFLPGRISVEAIDETEKDWRAKDDE